uniref:Uncharacterized protein n=1 Tax=Steinernema glaseri TaxID=37863 RepID=A0A1I7Y807_9BILA
MPLTKHPDDANLNRQGSPKRQGLRHRRRITLPSTTASYRRLHRTNREGRRSRIPLHWPSSNDDLLQPRHTLLLSSISHQAMATC